MDADELGALVARFRTHLELRARSGLQGVPRAPIRPRATVSGAGPIELSPEPTREPSVNVPEVGARDTELPSSWDDEAPPANAPEIPPGAAGLAAIRDDIGDCRRCRLAGGRHNIVFGVGNPEAHLVFVGEAPGADEDRQGEPFVGAAGQLLTKMIAAMGYRREDVYICNVIKCRPPQNRNPEADEVAACEPFLKQQLAAIRPRMIVALGKFAAQTLLRDPTPITRLRGTFRSYEGIQLMPTFHPAYLLRNPDGKREAWADLKNVLAALRRMGFEPPVPPSGR